MSGVYNFAEEGDTFANLDEIDALEHAYPVGAMMGSDQEQRFSERARGPVNALLRNEAAPEPVATDVIIDITEDTAVVHPKPEPQPAATSDLKLDRPKAERNMTTINDFEEGIKGLVWGATAAEQSTRTHQQSRTARRHQNRQDEPNQRPHLRRGNLEQRPNLYPQQLVMHEKVSRVGRFLHKVGETAFRLEGLYYKHQKRVQKAAGTVLAIALLAGGGLTLRTNSPNEGEQVTPSTTTTTAIAEVSTTNTPTTTEATTPTTTPTTTAPNGPQEVSKGNFSYHFGSPQEAAAFAQFANTVTGMRNADPTLKQDQFDFQVKSALFAAHLQEAQKQV